MCSVSMFLKYKGSISAIIIPWTNANEDYLTKILDAKTELTITQETILYPPKKKHQYSFGQKTEKEAAN